MKRVKEINRPIISIMDWHKNKGSINDCKLIYDPLKHLVYEESENRCLLEGQPSLYKSFYNYYDVIRQLPISHTLGIVYIYLSFEKLSNTLINNKLEINDDTFFYFGFTKKELSTISKTNTFRLEVDGIKLTEHNTLILDPNNDLREIIFSKKSSKEIKKFCDYIIDIKTLDDNFNDIEEIKKIIIDKQYKFEVV